MRGLRVNGERICELRKLLAMTQEQLAIRAACDVKTLRKAEQSGNVDVSTLRKLAAALGVSEEELLT